MIEDITGYIDFNSANGDWVVVFDKPVVTSMCSVTRLVHYETLDRNDIELGELKPGDAVICRVKMRHGASEKPVMRVTKL